jgi:hypothetical protein
MAALEGRIAERFQPTICEKKQPHGSVDDGLSECSTSSENNGSLRIGESISDVSSIAIDDVETMVIFDFDDTLFPTSWLQQQGLFHADAVLNENEVEQLEMLGETALRMLESALQLGRVLIVTNALEGWVEMCWEKMMPSLMPLLEKVDVVSARSDYADVCSCPSEWKRLAFDHEVRLLELTGAAQYNVISLGDALHEQLAVKAVREKRSNCYGKSVKFLTNPTPEQLILQHEFVVSNILDVSEYCGHQDLEIAL